MRSSRHAARIPRRFLRPLAFVAVLGLAAAARAQSPDATDLDDPKIVRRMPADAPAATAAAPATAAAATAAAAAAAPAGAAWPYTPRVKLGYRRFSFVRIGAVNLTSPTGGAMPETFSSLSLDLYPLSWFVRLGLSSQFGWESGGFDRSGDYFLAQTFSLGAQIPGRVTPFVEGFAGAGYMRRRQFDMTIPTAYWQLGIDAGAEIYVSGRAFVSLAFGYLRPVNGFLLQQSFTSVYVDTWSLKLGVGI